MEAREVLNRVKNGEISVEEAENILRENPMKNWATPSWICTGKSAPVFRK